MLRKPVIFSVLFALFLMASCSRTPSPSEANRLLVGRWELVIGQDCSDYGIKSDTLILQADGKLEQHFVSIYNQRYDATNEHWSYSPNNHINLDTRRNFFTKQPPTEVIGVPVPENLIVEFGKPSIIVLNPDGNCFYRKVGNG